MDSVGALLTKALHKRGIKHEAEASWMIFAANEWLNGELPAIEEEIEALKFCDNTLWIAVQSSIAAQEVHSKKCQIIDYLQEKFPGAKIDKLRISRALH